MFPVVMVLVVSKWTDPAGCDVQCRMAEMVRVADGRVYECRNEGIINESIAVFTAIVPWTRKIGTCLFLTVTQCLNKLARRFKMLRDFLNQPFSTVVREHIWISDVAIVMKRINIRLRRDPIIGKVNQI